MAMQKRLPACRAERGAGRWERSWTKGAAVQAAAGTRKRTGTPQLYTLKVFLTDGPITKAFAGKEISRTIQKIGRAHV